MMANGDDSNWLNQTWQDDPNTRWITPPASPVATVNVQSGVGGGTGTGSPFANYVQDRVADRLRAQGYDVRPAAPAVSTGGVPVARIGPDGKPLPGTMPTSGNPAWQAMLAQQQRIPNQQNALQPRSLDEALGWLSAMQQHNPSFLDTLLRWLGLRQQQYGSAEGFMAGGGGPRYVLGGGPATPQARPLTYATDTPATPAVAPAAYASRPAASPASRAASPGWFMPTNPALNQGGAWVSPQGGQPWLDTSPPALPYADWQQT